MKLKWFLFFVIILVLVFAPWQALQTSWTVHPLEAKSIHWHKCLAAGAAQVTLRVDQRVLGYTIENLSSEEPLQVTACE